VGGTTQTAHFDVNAGSDNNNPGATYGIVGGGPAVGNHVHNVHVVGDTQAFPVVQKTMIRNAIIKV
jgi:hypothetical protein